MRARALWSIGKIEFTREAGKMTPVKEKATRGTQTETVMRATSTKEKPTAKVSTTGPMEKSMTASGSMA